MNIILQIILIISLWIALTIYLSAKHKGEYSYKHIKMHFYIPFILIGSLKISKLIEKISKKLPKALSKLLTIIAVITMILTLYMLFKTSIDYILLFYNSGKTPPQISPRLALAIPGINPIIPISYGIVALIIAIVIHEFAHGVVAKSEDLTIEDTGLLLFLIPVGAYVNIKEEELKKAPSRKKIKVYSAGPASNIVLACILLLAITGIGNYIEVREGVLLLGGIEGSHAYGKILEGDILIGIENYKVSSVEDIQTALEKSGKRPGDIVNISVLRGSELLKISIVLSEKYNLTSNPEDLGKPFIGVLLVPINGSSLASILKRPYYNIIEYLSLPFIRLAPISKPVSLMFDVPYPNIFWPTYNTLYWLFWINLILGLANVLPAFPFDGYGVISSIIETISEKIKVLKSAEKAITALLSLLIYIMIVLPYVGSALFR